MLRLGSLNGASLIYLIAMWVCATATSSLNGGIRSFGLVLFVALPVSAAWLFGYRAALLTTGICMATALVFVLLEVGGVSLPRLIPGTPFGIWGVLLIAVLIGVIPVAQVLRSLWDAVDELRQNREHLQQLVEHRTEQLVEARDQAQAASRAKSDFLATVSHELRSPLNTILLLCDPMSIDAESAGERQQNLHLIRRSGLHLLHLINDVLDSAKIEAGQIVVENAPFDLRELICELTDMMRVRAEEKRLDLLVEKLPEWPRFIQGDRAKLRHILVNLMDNAIKYTDRGRVTLGVEVEPLGSTNQLRLRFEVTDTGIGISPQDQARIFEPFTRLGNAARRSGTGLGLSITRQYANAIGGSIHLESVLGGGSRFRVDAPVDVVADGDYNTAKTTQPRIVGLATGHPEYRVLIIEDRSEDRMILCRLLEGAGFRVQATETGESGVEVFQSWRPHFVWVDRQLPLMDGLEAARRIRSLDGSGEVKIVGYSASVFDSERAEMLAAGLDDFVQKPCLANEILDCMARHLGVEYRWSDTASVE
ncbi:MAG TPA: ATP-binding protein [Bryobacteraceae bacterium]